METEISQLLLQDPEKCVNMLNQYLEGRAQDDLDALQLAAEVHFELGNAQEAYNYLQRALALDPDGSKGGYSKFLWIGQLVGGYEGLKYYDQGLQGTSDTSQQVQALLGMIEIWMTDLCMEEAAESQCESLIAKALLIEEANPEAWSILGSIRISQQREKEAAEALAKSWTLYEAIAQPHHIPALIRLCQSMLECGLYNEALDLTTLCARLDDEVPDIYYLNALAHQLGMQQDGPDETARHVTAIRGAVELLSKLPEVDPEMASAAEQLVASLPEVEPHYSDSDAEAS